MIRRVPAAASLSLLCLVQWACADRASRLPVYDTVPHFVLTDSSGKPFDSNALKGKVWVADFIYTHCPGPCPRMTSQMHEFEKKINGDADARLVSFSVDPDRDTPPVLQEFANRFGGPTEKWFFLTGRPEILHRLARNVFKVGDLIGVMDHSTKFILVDKQGRIRGYYSTFDAEGLTTLLEDARTLERSAA